MMSFIYIKEVVLRISFPLLFIYICTYHTILFKGPLYFRIIYHKSCIQKTLFHIVTTFHFILIYINPITPYALAFFSLSIIIKKHII
ncbi:hypothetical protein BDA99DRAFT_160338 [Phascolomyces articulosus]|uniref:Uncharacterized protein n=1 Tax=Phascolomyces articulosus TaxID=60185 RepID=A0AAD5K446_9FUNG|nr:hypothetical protein BDA99DRAFT_160338 [Phascolomyces articulosus]